MAWQYCDRCKAEINPQDEDIIVGSVDCQCGNLVELNYLEDRQRELLRELYLDVQNLKADLKFVAMKLEVEY